MLFSSSHRRPAALLASLAAALSFVGCAEFSTLYVVEGVIRDEGGTPLSNIEVACGLFDDVHERETPDADDDANWHGAITTRSNQNGFYSCAEMGPSDEAPDPIPGQPPRDLVVRFVDDDGAQNDGPFATLELFVPRVDDDAPRTVDVTLQSR